MASAGVGVGVGSVGPGLSDPAVTRLTCLLESFIRDCDCKKLAAGSGSKRGRVQDQAEICR